MDQLMLSMDRLSNALERVLDKIGSQQSKGDPQPAEMVFSAD